MKPRKSTSRRLSSATSGKSANTLAGVSRPEQRKQSKNGQAITAAWVEKREAYESHTPYDEYDETPDTTTKTIELWVTFAGDLRPTRFTSNETEYVWRSMSPDFRLTRGEVTVNADSAHIEPDWERPWR